MENNFSLKEEIKCDFLITEKRKKIWKIELELLSKLIEVCEKYHLKYFLIGGSMIGAVRHQGFIPWDDDIDVALFRKDYEKLLEVAPKEFPKDMFFQTPYTDSLFRGHAQLRKENTTAILKNDIKYSYHQGIFIDIFPYDEYPKGKIKKYIQQKRLNILSRIMSNYYVPEHSTILGEIMYKCCSKPLIKLFGIKKIYKHYEKICAKYNGKGTTFSNLSFIYGPEKYMSTKEEMSKFITVPFENLQVVIPESYDILLKRAYGNYMVCEKVSSTHGDVFFSSEKSYKEFIKEYKEGKINLEDYYLE